MTIKTPTIGKPVFYSKYINHHRPVDVKNVRELLPYKGFAVHCTKPVFKKGVGKTKELTFFINFVECFTVTNGGLVYGYDCSWEGTPNMAVQQRIFDNIMHIFWQREGAGNIFKEFTTLKLKAS